MPVIGELAGAPGLFVAGGTYSFTFAPLWGHILTEQVHGRRPELDVTAFSPNRLVRLQAY
jgi:sarcosine oxidase subunit beta